MIHNSSRQQRSLQQEHFDSLHRDKTETLSNHKLFSANDLEPHRIKEMKYFLKYKKLTEWSKYSFASTNAHCRGMY